MAATQKKNIWFYKSPDGNPPEKVYGKIAASQGILIPNSPMYLSTSGTWKAADTSDGTGDTIHGLFAGLKDKSQTWPITAELAENTEIEVSLIDVDDYYCVFVETSGSDAAMADSLKGDSVGLTVSTTSGQVGYTSLNTANTNATVIVREAYANVETAKASASDSPGIAIVQFLNANVNASKA